MTSQILKLERNQKCEKLFTCVTLQRFTTWIWRQTKREFKWRSRWKRCGEWSDLRDVLAAPSHVPPIARRRSNPDITVTNAARSFHAGRWRDSLRPCFRGGRGSFPWQRPPPPSGFLLPLLLLCATYARFAKVHLVSGRGGDARVREMFVSADDYYHLDYFIIIGLDAIAVSSLAFLEAAISDFIAVYNKNKYICRFIWRYEKKKLSV